jgi:hypothetical protein
MRWTLVDTAVLAAQIILIEVLAYNFLPEKITAFAPLYRKPIWVQDVFPPADSETSRRTSKKGYPRYYFKADPDLGIDITPNAPPMSFSIKDTSLEIFSNDLGCFDRSSAEDYKQWGDYDYFGGDSFTWGYANYEDKFAVIYENKSGRHALKCGVTNTGTSHQYLKFKKTVGKLGINPRRVIVGYYMNDPDNDRLFPHSTVVNGYMVDTYYYKGKAVKSKDLEKVSERIQLVETLRRGEAPVGIISHPSSAGAKVAAFLQKNSLLYNVAYALLGNILLDDSGSIYTPSEKNWYNYRSDYIYSAYTEKNREAIKRWSADASKVGYELIFLLIPPKEFANDTGYYEQLREYLKSLSIKYVDISADFKGAKMSKESFYWKLDGHLNSDGNRFIGSRLSEYLR